MMLKTLYILLLILCVTSCRQNEETMLKSQLPGTYIGLAPCAHCDGVFSGITFEKDGTVWFYSSPDQQKATSQKGCWNIANSLVCVIMRSDTFYYRPALPDSIISLYRDRQNPKEFIESYTLKKYLQKSDK